VGETVTGVFCEHGLESVYVLTAPSDGTLILRLGWDRSRGVLELRVGETLFAPPPGSQIEAKLPVIAGHQYRVSVADAAPWDYDVLFLPFVLTTSIQ